jgi:hypothetical protein
MDDFRARMKELTEQIDGAEGFADHIDSDMVLEALAATSDVKIRRRKFPAERIVWLIVGMGLYANVSIRNIVTTMRLTIKGRVVSSAISQARARMGFKPIKWLFELLASNWRKECAASTWKGLSLMGFDGTVLNVPDSEENVEYFRKCRKTTNVAYPQVRLLALMDLGQRLLYRAVISPFSQGEMTSAKEIIKDIPDRSLVLFDRGFSSRGMMHDICKKGKERHFLGRIKSNSNLKILEHLSDGSALVEATISPQAREGYPGAPKSIKLRLVAYAVKNNKPSFLLTSLLDEKGYPGKELADLYHKRWELEIAFDELKTHMLFRKEALRSKTPEGILQELWGTLIAYNLVRREMALIAEENNAQPSDLSFSFSLLSLNVFFQQQALAPCYGTIPKFLQRVREDIWHHRLAPRDHRSNPRQVKLKQSIFPRKPGRPLLPKKSA